MDFIVVIPARYASTRLPGKPLADVGGDPLVVRVAQQAKASGAREVLIATDHEAVARAAEKYGFSAWMTRADHPSGTDRIAEVVEQRKLPDEAVVVNVQGDEPLIDPQLIREVALHLEASPQAAAASACHPITDASDLFRPHVVKVVLDRQGDALYFSRAPIPYARDAFGADPAALPSGLPAYRHVGLYAYRAGFLRLYRTLEPSPLERFEALEQLRLLWHGHRIALVVTDRASPPGVDTPEDLQRVRRLFCPPEGAV